MDEWSWRSLEDRQRQPSAVHTMHCAERHALHAMVRVALHNRTLTKRLRMHRGKDSSASLSRSFSPTDILACTTGRSGEGEQRVAEHKVSWSTGYGGGQRDDGAQGMVERREWMGTGEYWSTSDVGAAERQGTVPVPSPSLLEFTSWGCRLYKEQVQKWCRFELSGLRMRVPRSSPLCSRLQSVSCGSSPPAVGTRQGARYKRHSDLVLQCHTAPVCRSLL